jgi:hypothetical protein
MNKTKHAEAAEYWRRYLAMLNPNGQHARASVYM